MNNISTQNYQSLITDIGTLLNRGREQVAQTANTILVQTYWLIGRHIVEFEQNGQDKAEYGSDLLNRLSKDLTKIHGKGFSRTNIALFRQFYLKFQIVQTVSEQFAIPVFTLSWSHYVEIIKEDNPLAIGFYTKQTEKENWSVRELKRQMKSMLFHRLALSKDKDGVLALAERGQEIARPQDILRDPVVLEFLNIPQAHQMQENELEEQLISNLQHFLLELGKGFAFIGRQYRISLGGKHFYVDLVFYHRILKCFVLIDLKRGEVNHQDIGQMNMYLNYFRKEENVDGDNEPIGIVLGAYKDKLLVEYALDSIDNQLFVSKYQLYLPNREELERELERYLG